MRLCGGTCLSLARVLGGYVILDNNVGISRGDNGGLGVCAAGFHPQRSRNSEMVLISVIISSEGAVYLVGKCSVNR